MEQARKITTGNAERPSARPRPTLDDLAQISRLEKVLHVAFPGRDAAAGEDEGETAADGRPVNRNVAEAIERVRGASAAMRTSDERVRETESRMEDLVQRATEELKAADVRVQAADARTQAAELRAEEAEQRLADAEEWLAQIFSVISEELPEPA